MLIHTIVDPPLWIFILFIIGLSFAPLIFIKKFKWEYCFAVSSFFLTYTAAESFVRYFDLASDKYAEWTISLAKSEQFKPLLEPNSKLVFKYPGNPRAYFDSNNEIIGTVNSNGFRGKATNYNNSKSLQRVVFLGDSFTMGIGVRDQDTFPAQLEKLLLMKDKEVEILNFGISGTNTQEQVELLEKQVLKYRPDSTIITLFLNDTNSGSTVQFFSEPLILFKVRKHLRFMHMSLNVIEKTFLNNFMIKYYKDSFKENSPGWKSVQTQLLRAKSLLNASHSKFAVVIYPVLYNLDENYPFVSIHNKIVDFCTKNKIEVIDLLPAFLGKQDQELWVHAVDQHPNEKAHKLAAAYLEKKLLLRKIIE